MRHIKDIIPNHIHEKYPLFVEYIKGYYEWLSLSGKPSYDLNKHLDRKTLKDMSDEYNSYLFEMLMHNIPDNIYSNKDIALYWNKKIHSTKGSKQSIKLLFKMLYGEDISIFLPKSNLFSLSSGKWVSNEKLIYISIPYGTNLDSINIRYLKQPRSLIYDLDIVADVQRIKPIYTSKLILLEVYVKASQVFDIDKPIFTQDNTKLSIIHSITDFEIINKGIQYQVGDRIYTNETFKMDINAICISNGYVNPDIDNFLTKYEVNIFLNDIEISKDDYRLENGLIYSDLFIIGDNITMKVNAPTGLFIVKKIDEFGSILDIEILSTPIGIKNSFYLSESDQNGKDALIKINTGVFRETEGIYLNTTGRLSDKSFLHDSNYYQNYSYVINTQRDISEYSSILINTVHPSGIKFFGSISIISFFRNIIDVFDLPIDSKTVISSLPNYGLGTTFKDIEMFKGNSSDKVYTSSSFDKLDLSIFDKSIKIDRNLVRDGMIEGEYGMLSKNNLSDCYLTMPDNYILDDYEEYWDTEYISLRV